MRRYIPLGIILVLIFGVALVLLAQSAQSNSHFSDLPTIAVLPTFAPQSAQVESTIVPGTTTHQPSSAQSTVNDTAPTEVFALTDSQNVAIVNNASHVDEVPTQPTPHQPEEPATSANNTAANPQNVIIEALDVRNSVEHSAGAAAQTVGSNPANLTSTAAASNPQPPQPAALRALAQENGSIRVIVQLNESFIPEGRLERSMRDAQRSSIRQMQARLLRQVAPDIQTGSTITYESVPFVAMTISAAGLEKLLASDDVFGITLDIPLHLLLDLSSPFIAADTAWAAGHEGTGQAVAIIDSGVDGTHPFFQDRVVSEACFSFEGTLQGTEFSSLCSNGQPSEIGPGAGAPCTIDSLCFHGTHVAGIAAGRNADFSGVARDADIIAIQIASQRTSCTSNCMSILASNVIQALEYVLTLSESMDIAAVNLSLGSTQTFSGICDTLDPAQKAAIDNLLSVGIATIAGSGNGNQFGTGITDGISFPACLSNTISVGATSANPGQEDTFGSFSNSSSQLDLLAPGVDINSANPGGDFVVASGTSMATPQVSGAWTLLKSVDPTASPGQILAALQNSGVLVTDSRNGVTTPRIQVDAAVTALVTDPRPRYNLWINEVQVEAVRAVEIYNADGIPAVLTDWHLVLYGSSNAIELDYTFPDTFTLAPGEFLVLKRGTGIDSTNELFLGNFTTSWTPAGSGAAELTNGHVGIDFVRWGNSTVSPGPANAWFGINPSGPSAGQTIGRDPLNFDRDRGQDWSAMSPTLGIVNQVMRPDHDDFNTPRSIDTLPFSNIVSTILATNQANEPVPDCSPDTGKTVWYQFDADSDDTITFSTAGSDYDTAMAIWTDVTTTPQQVACNDDIILGQVPQSQITLSPTTGTSYFIQVGGFAADSGELHFNADTGQGGGTGGNDDFDGAIEIDTLPFTHVQNTTLATTVIDDPLPSGCPSSEKSVWFKYTAAEDGTVTIDTFGSDYDTILSVWVGTRGNLVEVGCHDDIDPAFGTNLLSQMGFPVSSGITYYIMVSGGIFADSGNLVFNAAAAPEPPPNDDFADAIEISSLPFNDVQNNQSATLDSNDPNPSCDISVIFGVNHTIWYKYTPISNQILQLSTTGSSSGFGQLISVWTNPPPPNMSQFACDDNLIGSVNIHIQVEAGTTYYMMLGGVGTLKTGELAFSVEELELNPPPLISPSDGTIVESDQILLLDWDGVANAVSYHVQIDDRQDFASPIIDEVVTATEFSVPTLDLGDYYWRVRAQSADAFAGPYSEVRHFVIAPAVQLGNFIWLDANADGLQDPNEPGLEGIQIELYRSDDTLLATTTSDQNGHYTFTVDSGNYYLKTSISNMTFSPANQGSNATIDSDYLRLEDRTAIVSIAPGIDDLDLDIGAIELPVCTVAQDIMLVLDGSSSTSSSDYKRLTAFAGDLVDSLLANGSHARLGAVQHENAAGPSVLSALTDEANTLHTAIENSVQGAGSEDLAGGIALAQTTLRNNRRSGARPVMIIFTLSAVTANQDAIAAAQTAQLEGTELFIVPVGGLLDESLVESLASHPSALHRFDTNTAEQLVSNLQAIVTETCPPVPQVDLSIEILTGRMAIRPNQMVSLVFEVHNNSAASVAATDVSVSLSDGYDIITSEVQQGRLENHDTWYIGSLAGGAAVQLRLDIMAPQNPIEELTADANINYTSANDSNLSDNSASLTLPLAEATSTRTPLPTWTPTPEPVQQTVGVYQQGSWTFRDMNTGTVATTFNFGPQESGWQPIIGDWNGDGIDGIGVYKEGLWMQRETAPGGTVENIFRFGDTSPHWQTVAGDWDADGRDSVGLYYDGLWVLGNEDGSTFATIAFAPSMNGDATALAGDWNNNGQDSVGLYQNGLFTLLLTPERNSNVISLVFGPGDGQWHPVVGDWDLDGSDTIGLYLDGNWRLRNSNSSGGPDAGFSFPARGIPLTSLDGGISAARALATAPITPTSLATAAPGLATLPPTKTIMPVPSTPSPTATLTPTATTPPPTTPTVTPDAEQPQASQAATSTGTAAQP